VLIRSRSNTLKNIRIFIYFFIFFLLYFFVIEYEHSTQTEEKKIIRELKEISAMKHISDLEPKALIPKWYGNQPKGKYGTDYLDDQDQE